MDSEQVIQELGKARLVSATGKGNVNATFEQALKRSRIVRSGGRL
jgi:hypothetical protein